MTRIIAQIGIALVLSLVLFEALGAVVYIGFAAFVFFVVLGVFYNRHGLFENDEDAPGFVWLMSTVGMAFAIATCWAVVVLAWAWKDVVRDAIARGRDDDKPDAGGSPGA